MSQIYEPDRAIIEADGTHHYGLIRTAAEKTFAVTMSAAGIDLPEVNVADLPESQGIENWCQIEDQMQQGSCQGNARTTAEEVALYRQTEGTVIQLSRQFAYITSQKEDGINGDRGSTMEGGAKASTRVGSCLEELAPYTGKYYTKFSQAAYDDAATRKLTSWVRLESYMDVLKWQVWGIGGAVIGIGWNGTMEPDGQGKIERYSSGGGGHALALPQWNKRFMDAGGMPYLDMFNSWSKRWGFQGRAFIKPSIVDYWCKNETVLGYSKMSIKDIKPKSYDWLKQSFYV